jgi:hypothetical protein
MMLVKMMLKKRGDETGIGPDFCQKNDGQKNVEGKTSEFQIPESTIPTNDFGNLPESGSCASW